MKKKISLIQNYACFDKHRAAFVLDNLDSFANILNYFEIKAFINYNATHYFSVLKEAYESRIDKVLFENDLGDDWCDIVEQLLLKVETPYVMCLCEDFFYLDDLTIWENTLEEAFVVENADYLHLGEIFKGKKRLSNFDYSKESCRYYTPKSGVHQTIALDGIHKTENLLAHIRAIKDHYQRTGKQFPGEMFKKSRINFPERYSGEIMGGFSKIFETSFAHFETKKYLCAWPKNMIVEHAINRSNLRGHKFIHHDFKSEIAIEFLETQK